MNAFTCGKLIIHRSRLNGRDIISKIKIVKTNIFKFQNESK